MIAWLFLGWIWLQVIANLPIIHAWTLFPRSSTVPSAADYDLVIIGAGASGLFASGAATMLGSKTLFIDQPSWIDTANANVTTTPYIINNNIGGDCTNAACVPSKAIRSVARMAVVPTHNRDGSSMGGRGVRSWLGLARSHATQTVGTVRNREDPQAMVECNPNLDIAIVSDCQFLSPHELSLTVEQCFFSKTSATSNNSIWNNPPTSGGGSSNSSATTTTTKSQRIIQSKKFLLATGAAPIIPPRLQESAQAAGLPTYTYQTLLRPSTNETSNANSIWNWDPTDNTSTKRIVIVGGGATACELAQSLARLLNVGGACHVDLVAPTLLRGEDVTLANAAAQLLRQEGIHLYLRATVQEILMDRRIRLSNQQILPPCDAIIFCTGRSPGPSLAGLQLSKANVEWDPTRGVVVRGKHHLQSISAPHVYACGDCCSAIAPLSRCATHAAWTGYYAAIQARLGRFLTWGAKVVHPTVPRVIYTDPELVAVGLSLEECVAKFGMDGFVQCHVATNETDRSDMDRLENKSTMDDVGFIELRATKVDGKLLGMTGCGPTASELANEMSVILENGLTAMDVARSLHSYPSHGYILHRVALAIALGNIWGLIEASGTIGRCLSWLGRKVSKLVLFLQNLGRSSALKAWEAEGVSKTLYHAAAAAPSSLPSSLVANPKVQLLTSFMTQFHSSESRNTGSAFVDSCHSLDATDFYSWVSRRPLQSHLATKGEAKRLFRTSSYDRPSDA